MVLESLSWRVACSNHASFRLFDSCEKRFMWSHKEVDMLHISHKDHVTNKEVDLLHISHKDHVTNKEVLAKIQQAIGPHEDLLTIVKRRKLKWYGHVSGSSGLAKTFMRGTVKGGRRQGRQRKRWEDNIRERTGLEFVKSQRAVKKREKWRKLVVKPSVVPQ